MIRTMVRMHARPGCEPAVEAAWRAVASQIDGVAGNLRWELLQDAADPRSYVAVTEWVDESALRDHERGPVAARLADAVRPLCEPSASGDRRVMREPDGGNPSMIYVDVELLVPAARRAEFERGHAEVIARMAGVPGYLREELLRDPGSDVHHIFAEWRSEAEFHRWIGNPAHAQEEAGPIAEFLLKDFRRSIFHPATGVRGREVTPVRTVLAMRTREGCEHRFETEWLTAAEKIRTLAGCLRQDLVRDAEDPRSYLVISDWADRERLDAFGRSEQRDHLLRVIRDLRESAQRNTYQVLHSVRSEPGEPS